jgi:hypothetical protein
MQQLTAGPSATAARGMSVDDDDFSDYEEYVPPAAAYVTDANANKIIVEQIFGWRMPLTEKEQAAEHSKQKSLQQQRVQRVAALKRGESPEQAQEQQAGAAEDAAEGAASEEKPADAEVSCPAPGEPSPTA